MTLRLTDHRSRKDLLAAVAENVTKAGGEAVVIGLPLLHNGEDSLMTRQVRNVAARLQRRIALPFYFMPEFLSSEEAWDDLREAGVKAARRRAILDQQAAVRILSSFLTLAPEIKQRQAL